MEIAYVSTYLPQRCGIAAYTSFLIDGIRETSSDVKVRVIAEKEASPVKNEFLEVIPCWSRNEDYVKQILAHVGNVDVIHVQHEYSIYKFDERLPSLLRKIPSNIKKVLTIHCVRPGQVCERGNVDEEYSGKIARLADHIIVHLDSQRIILSRLGIPTEKISVIPHGTKIDDQDREASRKRLNLPLDGKILLMFGFVKPHKCIHIALEALHKVLKELKNVYLFIAGGLAPNAPKEHEEYARFVKRRIMGLGLEKNVIFGTKYFTDEDVPYLFGASDIVLFPYYEEDRSASGSLHLSIGAGKIVIASRIPKFEELKSISDELLVLPYNVDAIANLILRIFTEPEFNQFLFKRTMEYREITSWKNIAKKHLELYKKLL